MARESGLPAKEETMSNLKRNQLKPALAVTLPLVFAIAGCGGDGETGVEEPVPTSVEISPGGATLESIDATQGFAAVVRDQNGKAMPNASVSWSSSDAAVFTVSGSGSTATVTATGNGTGTLTATSGQASGTASVEVEQRVARIQIVSGDGQEGPTGQLLPEPLVVRVEDQGGTGVAGVEVTFTPGSESGSVSEGSVTTDADGMAATDWTLGTARTQSVSVASGSAAVEFKARAVSENPMPDLELTSMVLPEQDPAALETFEIGAEITNLGDAATPATFPLRLSVDGSPLETVDVPQLEPDGSTALEFTVGPLDAGGHTIELALDPDDQIEEWQEENNSASESIRILNQQSIDLNSPVTVSSNTVNEVILFRVDIAAASDEALNVELSGGSGDADMFVHYGERPNHHYRYRCLSGNAASDEFCQLVPTRVGTYHIAVHAYTAFGPSTLEVTVGGKDVETYDVDLVFVDEGTNTQNSIVRQAAERWEAVIGQGVADFDYSGNPQPAGTCGPGSPSVSDVVDDIRIYVTIDSIDGGGGSGGNILGQATPCSWRIVLFQDPVTGQPDTITRQVIRGFIRLDEYDVGVMESRGVLPSVVTHELAHVLGFGTVWPAHGRLRDPSIPDKPNADTHFDGPLTIAAFDAAGGAGYGGRKVPVENTGVRGSADGHWRQSVFEDEMMTPFLTGSAQPMSAITLESLYEIGYEINLREAESFALSRAGVAGMAVPRGPVIYLGNDIARIPMRGFDQKTGRVVKVIYPERR